MFKNKYNLIILVLGLVLVLGGCVKKDGKIEVKNDKQPVVVNDQQTVDQPINTDSQSANNNVDSSNSNSSVDNSNVKNDEIDTSDWLTYYNTELDFEIKYPNKWQIQKEPNKELSLTFKYHPSNIDAMYAFDNHLVINIKENKTNLTLEDYIKLNKNSYGYFYAFEKYREFDGYLLFEGEINNMGTSIVHQVSILKNDKIIDINFEYFYKESLEDFNQIFSTLRFIKK